MVSSHKLFKKLVVLTESMINSLLRSSKLIITDIFAVFLSACTMRTKHSFLPVSNFLNVIFDLLHVVNQVFHTSYHFDNFMFLLLLVVLHLLDFYIKQPSLFNSCLSIFASPKKLLNESFTKLAVFRGFLH